MTHASRDTTTGLLFEQRTKGQAAGIPLHKGALGTYFKEKTGKYYSLTGIRRPKMTDEEKANKFEGQYLLSKGLEPDEAYLDEENGVLTIFEKKTQSTSGSVDEKLQTCAYKIIQYRKVAQELGIKTVYFIYILDNWYNSPRYKDTLDYIKSVDGCDYFFWEGINGSK